MSKFTRDELIKFRDEWNEIRKSEKEIDYSIYRNDKIHRRYIMEKRAYDITYRERNKRKNAILDALRDDIQAAVMAYASRPKYLDENGKLIFLDERND